MAQQQREQVIGSVQRTLSRLMRASASRSTFARQSAAGGVTLRQPSYDILRAMIETGPVAMGELARLAQMDVGMVTREVRALVEDGLVSRSPDPDDGRVTLVAPTDAGRAAAEALMSVRSRHLQAALADWTQQDLDQLDELLTRFLADALDTPFQPE